MRLPCFGVSFFLVLFATCYNVTYSYATCIKGDCVNGEGTYTWANGTKYVGEFMFGKHNGQGTKTWPDGSKYVGIFINNQLNIEGTFTWANGNKYVGEWKDGEMNGQGTYTWANGDQYVGEWKNGEIIGQGTWTVVPNTIDFGKLPSGQDTEAETETEFNKCRNNLINNKKLLHCYVETQLEGGYVVRCGRGVYDEGTLLCKDAIYGDWEYEGGGSFWCDPETKNYDEDYENVVRKICR